MKEKKIQKNCLAAVLLLLSLASCTDDITQENTPSAPETTGKITFYTADYAATWEDGTRSLEPVNDRLQKQIHNLYYFFYDAEGYLDKIFYQNVMPTMKVEVTLNDFKDEHTSEEFIPNGIVYIIANAHKMDMPEDAESKPQLVSCEHKETSEETLTLWKQTVPTVTDFKRNSLFPLFLGSGGVHEGFSPYGRPDHIVMFGYFDATMLEKNDLYVPMGRICARLHINLSGPGLGSQARISVNNAPKQSVIYPEDMKWPVTDFFTNFTETIDTGNADDNKPVVDQNGSTIGISCGEDGKYGGITGTAGNYEGEVYYYCGENNYNYTQTKTTLTIETWDTAIEWGADQEVDTERIPESGVRTYRVELGHNGPDVTKPPYNEARDYNLYRNTSYTFNIKLSK